MKSIIFDGESQGSPELLQIQEFLEQNFLFRNNVLNGKYEVALIKEENPKYRAITTEVWNSIIWQLQNSLPEVKNVKKKAETFVYSENTPTFDPFADYMNHLPAWNGKDYVGDLADAIPDMKNEQKEWFSIWMRSMVAHWMKIDTLHGNDVVLLLIGEQGCGKSTFCQRILPEHLSEYFLDHLNLANKFDKEMALSHNLLVNIDEFDQVKNSQQAELKHTISKSKVNGRRIYGSVQTEQHRYASFVATTNSIHPLKDPTGSRRYLCIEIGKGELIDNTYAIDHEQLYAQIMQEIQEGERCYFNREETIALQKANLPYQQIADFATMAKTCFRKPRKGEVVKAILIPDMLDEISMRYPNLSNSHQTKINLGVTMKTLGYQSIHTKKGNAYYAVPKVA